MSTIVFGYVVTRHSPPLTLDLPAAKQSTVVVGTDIDPPEWDEIQIGSDPPITLLGTVRIFLEGDAAPWAACWLRKLQKVASPGFPWPDPGYRFFKVSFDWPTGASVIQLPEPSPLSFGYVEAFAPTVIAELDVTDLEALAAV